VEQLQQQQSKSNIELKEAVEKTGTKLKNGQSSPNIEQQRKEELQEALRKEKERIEQSLLELSGQIKEQKDLFLKEGPLVYELYSILIHNGEAQGGHYYAFIKNIESDQ